MPTSYKNPHTSESYRFEEFEVLVHADTLLRNGERVRIQELPFRLLLILLENPGTVLSNEELGRRLGGAEWYVELGSLRVAVTKLREALQDNASAPRFIRTVSGQGYKFIAPVTPVFEGPSAAVPPETPAEVPAVEEPKSFVGRVAAAASRLLSSLTSRTARRAALVALTVVFVLGLSAYLLYRRSSRPIASERDMIVVGGFTNLTSDHALDGTLSSAFLVKMQESPYLNLLMDRKFRELIRNPEETTLNDELNACRALRGQVLLGGQLTGPGPDHRVVLLAWRCGDGHLLTEEKAEARSEAEILPALNRASEQMRKRLGEPDSSLQRFNVPLAQATTNSLAALRAFTQGEEERLQGLESESIRDFRFAIDLDPQFALAYARLGTIYYNNGEYALSRQNYQRAFELRGRTTDHERLYIAANYYMCATGEIERAIEAYELWHKIYPRDIAPVNNLAIQYLLIGQPKKAVDLARIGIQMDPNMNILYGTWSQAYLQSGNYEALNAFCRGAQG
ncbi:MAG TPA: winged helix-turn-helix domain-containing protein, partial [Isosphaeraceae bacterium]|nr:winged helix-turn-helix domain-containing protein [Isosphaeraceae bacterium]